MEGLLCLKWNNHSQAFLNLINNLHKKEQYCDATIACHGKFYPVHRMVLSTCSEYFEEIFKLIQCKHPFIIVNDVQASELEALLNYMYKGDVNVLQERLPSLIKAAEALKVKGLAVPDEVPTEKESSSSRKRACSSSNSSSHSKRHKLPEKYSKSSNSIDSVSNITQPNADFHSANSFTEVEQIRDENFDQLPLPYDGIKEEPLPVEEPSAEIYSQLDSEYSVPEASQQPLVKVEAFDTSYQTINKNEEIVEANTYSEESSSHWTGNERGSGATDESAVLIADKERERFNIAQFDPPTVTAPRDNCARDATGMLGNVGDRNLSSATPKICPHCSYSSTKVANLKRHVFAKHTSVRPFQCHVCPYRCVTKQALKRHLCRHTGEKPFSCAFCSFRSSCKRSVMCHTVCRHAQSR